MKFACIARHQRELPVQSQTTPRHFRLFIACTVRVNGAFDRASGLIRVSTESGQVHYPREFVSSE